jgi:hypothetical protein
MLPSDFGDETVTSLEWNNLPTALLHQFSNRFIAGSPSSSGLEAREEGM